MGKTAFGGRRLGGAVEVLNAVIEDAGCKGLGWKWQKTIHPQEVEHVSSLWAAYTYKNTDFQVRTRVRKHNGTYEWFAVKARPIKNNGKVLRWFGTLTNIEEYLADKRTLVG